MSAAVSDFVGITDTVAKSKNNLPSGVYDDSVNVLLIQPWFKAVCEMIQAALFRCVLLRMRRVPSGREKTP